MAGEATTAWDWASRGPPPLEKLEPVRLPRSSNRHRHIPVTAYSIINNDFVQLESGLEHDLLRTIDRDPNIRGVVSQPFRLSWSGCDTGFHYPDLLTWQRDGSVTVWDVRAVDRQNDDFRTKITVTRAGCEAVGWRHEVFAGLTTVERLNLLWLHGFRRRPAWANEAEVRIRAGIAGKATTTLGDLFAHDDGSGEVIAVMWHLIWSGALTVDMGAHWELDTVVETRRDRKGS
ncbi:TnsA-like heteromeric transposase endonuclease subunit [Mycobacteroides abscessus]|uniref:TnsA-like heteromeric transposase endonuclease subunit n=1 Tax=Mycobacteroides abscessus TaxID=36809 RepID=UPI001F1AECE1|nr:TnsA-like heteromeric transposase endonuclease subunit [Mycobacteroides abscessus]